MALDAVKEALRRPEKIPAEVEVRLKRGRAQLKKVRAKREECIEFVRGNHFVVTAEDGLKIQKQGIVAESLGGNRPDHRVRRSHDRLNPIIQAKVSAATQRIPAYEVIPSTNEPEDYSAAKISEKVLASGYEGWELDRAFQKLVWNALVTEEGFIRVFWDTTLGPFIDVSQHPENPDEPDPENPEYRGLGDVRAWVGNGLEVMWEQGVDFEESRWWAIETARPIDVLESMPDFEGGKLKPDATTSEDGRETDGSNLVLTVEYLERPCPKYPHGRRLIFANGKRLFPEENYPLEDSEGNVIDAPCIHRLTYTVNGSTERGRGLVFSLLDAIRSYDAAWNKFHEWVQTSLVPGYVAPQGSITTPITDEPGSVVEYDPIKTQGLKPEPKQIPNIPGEIFAGMDRALNEISEIAHVGDIPSQIRSGSGVATIYEKESSAWSDFVANLAKTMGKVGRDGLSLMQLYCTDERLIKFRGRLGWANIEDFRGAQLRNQTDVRVNPGSLEWQTREGVEKRIKTVAELFPKYFPPETIISALESGNAESLIEGYEQDVARANYIINQIRTGRFKELPERPPWPGEEGFEIDPATGKPEQMENGEPMPIQKVPGWMPRPHVDNVAVWKAVFGGWMKTDEWNNLDSESKQATQVVFLALLQAEEKQAERESRLREDAAAEQGLENAAKEQPERSVEAGAEEPPAPPPAEPSE